MITEQEALAIGVDLYSPVTMEVSRRQFTNIEPGKEPAQGP